MAKHEIASIACGAFLILTSLSAAAAADRVAEVDALLLERDEVTAQLWVAEIREREVRLAWMREIQKRRLAEYQGRYKAEGCEILLTERSWRCPGEVSK